jgi:uncharacterized surface protein with fasciclin (FAS1) repeats
LRKIQRLAAVGAMTVVAAMVGACSSSSQEPATERQASAPASEGATFGAESAAPTSRGITKISDIFGPACDRVLREVAGSPQGMVSESVATAASHNPLLSSPDPGAPTLVKAVMAANLVDILNDARSLTVFAPYTPAFQALEAQHPGIFKDLTTAPDVTSPNSRLAKILTYHVVPGRLTPAQLAGTHKTLEGGELTVAGSGTRYTVNGNSAVVCGNVQTSNATVYIVDTVLMPNS